MTKMKRKEMNILEDNNNMCFHDTLVGVIRHIPQGEHILSYSLIKPSFNKVGKSGLCIKIL